MYRMHKIDNMFFTGNYDKYECACCQEGVFISMDRKGRIFTLPSCERRFFPVNVERANGVFLVVEIG